MTSYAAVWQEGQNEEFLEPVFWVQLAAKLKFILQQSKKAQR
jgi:hypothetical protein